MIQMAANTRRGTRRAGLGPRTLLTIVILSTPAVAGDALVQAGLNRIANSIGNLAVAVAFAGAVVAIGLYFGLRSKR